MEDKKGEWLHKLKQGKGNVWLTGILIGLLLLVISMPSGEKSGSEKNMTVKEPDTETQLSENMQDNAQILEKRLEKVLRQVEGVGEVEVMITFRSSGEKIVEKDVRSSSNKSEQNQTDQGKSGSDSLEQEEATVYLKQEDGGEMPYVKEVKEPQVEGVVVAAEGGGNSVTAANITEAVMALFDIEAHKIKVMKKKL